VANFARQNNISLVLRFSSEPIEPDDRNSVLQGINRAVVYQNQLNITGHVLKEINSTPAGGVPGRQAFGPTTPVQPQQRPR
jgi:hypothetical protein